MLIDTHCHLSNEDYENIDDIIKNMDGIMIASGCNDNTNREVLELVGKYDNVYGTLGIHPDSVEDDLEELRKLIIDNLDDKKFIAIGEIGLDYHYGKENKDRQIEVFEYQLALAEEFNLPVIVHSREATQDTLDCIKKYKAPYPCG